MVRIERFWAKPSVETYQISPFRERIQLWKKHVEGVWIDPYAGNYRIADVTNDPRQGFNTSHHKSPLEFIQGFKDGEVSGVLWNVPNRMREDERQELKRIVRPGGVVFSFGKSSRGVGNKYGFWTELIVLSTAYDGSDDEIMVIERRNEQEYL